MRRTINRIMAIMAVAAMAFATGGCVEPLDNNVRGIDPDAVYLPIRLYIPGAIPTTKVSTGDVKGISAESQIHTVQVWMFSHGGPDTESAVAYAEAGTLTGQTSNLPNGSGYYNQPYNPGQNAQNTLDWSKGYWVDDYTYQIPLVLPKQVLELPAKDMKYDFYVLANAPSIGFEAGKTATRGSLLNATFGVTETKDYFGTSAPIISIADDGLPISGFFNKGSNGETSGVDLSSLRNRTNYTAAELHNILPIVQLERAVSRIRFAFAKPYEGETQNPTQLEITSIEINEELIPTSTFVFPRENGAFELPTSTSYVSRAAVVTGTNGASFVTANEIQAKSLLDNPEDLKPDSPKVFSDVDNQKSYYNKAPGGNNTTNPETLAMTAQQYSDLLDDYTASKFVYFRESDKVITGKIYYKVNGVVQTAKPFSMVLPSDQNYNNFHRNHSWTVYAYLKGGSLWIKPVLNKDWVYNVVDNIPQQYYKYEQTGEAHIVFSDKSQSLFGYGYTTSRYNDWYTKVSVSSIETEYSYSTNKVIGSWTTDQPETETFSANTYFWTRSKLTLSDGQTVRTVYSKPVAEAPLEKTVGEQTNTYKVSGITVQYASGSSSSVAPINGWSSNAPIWTDNYTYIWSRTATTYSNGDVVTDDVCLYKNTEWYFRRQDWESENQPYDWEDWVHSQMVVAPGLNAAGVPIYANRIELMTSLFDVPLRLMLINTTDFSLVVYHSDSDDYSEPASYADIPYNVAHNGGRTYFYVVPKDSAPAGAMTSVYLITSSDEGHPNPNPTKLPFNSNAFPGSQDYTEVYFYCVAPTTFQGYYTTQPDNIKAYDKNGEVAL